MSVNPRVSLFNTISYTYDAEGNILTATNSTGIVSFAYDDTGKLIKAV